MDWEPILILVVIFGTAAFVIKSILDYRLKQKLISAGMVDEKVKFLNFDKLANYAPSSLKWGLVMTFIGAGILLLRLYPGYVEDEAVFGTMLVAAGAGLLTYYFIANSMMNKLKNGNPPEDK